MGRHVCHVMAFVCAVLLGLLDCRNFVRTLGEAIPWDFHIDSLGDLTGSSCNPLGPSDTPTHRDALQALTLGIPVRCGDCLLQPLRRPCHWARCSHARRFCVVALLRIVGAVRLDCWVVDVALGICLVRLRLSALIVFVGIQRRSPVRPRIPSPP